MKSFTLLALISITAISNSAVAYTPKESSQSVSTTTKLVPTKVVNPTRLPSTFTRVVLNVEFSLDGSGQPRDIQVLSQAEANVKQQVVQAFKQWRFETAKNLPANGQRFVLPLEIIPEV